MKPWIVQGIAAATITLANPALAAKYDELRKPCNSTDLGALQQAVANAGQLAKSASATLPPHDSSGGARFKRWFGGKDGDYDPVVKQIYDEMSLTLIFQKFWCLPPSSDTPDMFLHTDAFIIRGTVGEIFVTSNFFKLAPTGPMSQAGTIVHESSHQSKARAVTDDDKHYGPKPAQDRAAASAVRARSTADNFKYYAEDVVYGVP